MAVLVLSLFLSGVARLAQNSQVGTWSLNESRSKMSRRSQKETNVVYKAVGDAVTVTIKGIESSGNPLPVVSVIPPSWARQALCSGRPMAG